MPTLDPMDMSVHRDPELFREVVNYTAAETLFAPRIIEKDSS